MNKDNCDHTCLAMTAKAIVESWGRIYYTLRAFVAFDVTARGLALYSLYTLRQGGES